MKDFQRRISRILGSKLIGVEQQIVFGSCFPPGTGVTYGRKGAGMDPRKRIKLVTAAMRKLNKAYSRLTAAQETGKLAKVHAAAQALSDAILDTGDELRAKLHAADDNLAGNEP